MGGVGAGFPDTYRDVPMQLLLSAYTGGARRLREGLDGLSDGELRAGVIPGKWTILEIMLHVADSELVGAVRIRMLLGRRPGGTDIVLPGYDQDEWSRELGYGGSDIHRVEEALALLEALRVSTSALFPAEGSPAWQRTGIHPETGPVTVRNLLELYADHSERHLEQILDRRCRLGKAVEIEPLLPRRLY